LRFAFQPFAPKEAQVYGLFGITVRERFNQESNLNTDTQFLRQFSGQTLLEALPRLHLTTRELPKPAQMGLMAPLGYEQFPGSEYQSRGNLDGS
jgi:hypothetical protein